MKKILISLLTGMLILGGFPWGAPAAKAANSITVPADLIINQGEVTTISGVQVTGDPGTIPIQVNATGGTVSLEEDAGITYTGPSSGSSIAFEGSLEDVNAALATLQFQNNALGGVSIEVAIADPGVIFWEGNGHVYEYVSVPGGVTYGAAKTAAESSQLNGTPGYLATITSQDENDYVAGRIGGRSWLGGTDSAFEGTWRWDGGPEDGQEFTFEFWNDGEPNNSGGNEHCVEFQGGFGNSGRWNDMPCDTGEVTGYVIEYGAPGNLPGGDTDSFSVTTVARPTLDSFTPVDGALEIERDAELTLTFNEAIDPNEGFVHIYQVDGDRLEESIDVESDRVFGGEVGTIIVQPSRLSGGEEFYVLIDADTFINAAGGTYAGLDDQTTWNFTTEASRGRQDRLARIRESEQVNERLDQEEEMIEVTEQELLVDEKEEEVPSENQIEVTVDEPQEDMPATEVKEEKKKHSSIPDGTLVKLAEQDTVYLVDNGERRPFSHFNIFFTWFDNFADVEVISQEEMASIQMGAPVLPKQGTLIKVTSMPEVYVVEGDGIPSLRHIKNEDQATEEFGEDWSTRVIDIEITLFQYFAK